VEKIKESAPYSLFCVVLCVCLMERGARVCERKGQSYYLNVFLSARDSFICVGRVVFLTSARTEIKNDFLFILASALRVARRADLVRSSSQQQQQSHCCTLQLRLIYAFRARPTRSLAKVGAAQPRALPLWQTSSARSQKYTHAGAENSLKYGEQ
jgi:hypothetical protein